MRKNFGTVFATLIPLTKRRQGLIIGIGLLLGGPVPLSHACAVCFGKTADPMIQGASLGILTLLGVVAAVLLSVSVFFVVLSRRCRRADQMVEMEYSPRHTMEVHHD